jgi:hypothetical protein
MLTHDGRSCWLTETSLLLCQFGALRRRFHWSVHLITHFPESDLAVQLAPAAEPVSLRFSVY